VSLQESYRSACNEKCGSLVNRWSTRTTVGLSESLFYLMSMTIYSLYLHQENSALTSLAEREPPAWIGDTPSVDYRGPFSQQWESPRGSNGRNSTGRTRTASSRGVQVLSCLGRNLQSIEGIQNVLTDCSAAAES